MGLFSELKEKYWDKPQRLRKAAKIAYEHEYSKRLGGETIKHAIASARKHAREDARKQKFGGIGFGGFGRLVDIGMNVQRNFEKEWKQSRFGPMFPEPFGRSSKPARRRKKTPRQIVIQLK